MFDHNTHLAQHATNLVAVGDLLPVTPRQSDQTAPTDRMAIVSEGPAGRSAYRFDGTIDVCRTVVNAASR